MIELAAQNLAIRLPLLLALFGLVVLGVLALSSAISRRSRVSRTNPSKAKLAVTFSAYPHDLLMPFTARGANSKP